MGDYGSIGDGRAIEVLAEDSPDRNVDLVGQTIAHLRHHRGWSLKHLSVTTGLSASFLSAVERGDTDISLRRLSRIASAFGHTAVTLLGYTQRASVFHYTAIEEIQVLNRGRGVEYEVRRSPGTEMEIIQVTMQPDTELSDSMSHMGIDTVLVLEGKVEIIVNHRPYLLEAGQSGSFAATHTHTLRNPNDQVARIVAVTTEQTFFST